MSKYYYIKPKNYANKDLDNYEADFYDESGDNESYEKYIPYYDEDNGEYKYVPASEVDADNSHYQKYASKLYAQEHGVSGDQLSKKLLDKIDSLKSEIKSGKLEESGKVSKLNDEILRLKEQILQIETKNQIQTEIEKFKKEFYENQKAQTSHIKKDYNKNFSESESQRAYRAPFKNQAKSNESIEKQGSPAFKLANSDMDMLVERLKNEIYIEKDLTSGKILQEIEKINDVGKFSDGDIIAKVNDIVSHRFDSIFAKVIDEINLNIEKKFENIYNKLAVIGTKSAIDNNGYNEIIGYIDEKIDSLKDSLMAQNEADYAKQQEILHKFTLAADKVEPGIIDTEGMYADTILDQITDIKNEIRDNSKERLKFHSDISDLKNVLTEITAEIHHIKSGLAYDLNDGLSVQMEQFKDTISKLEENFSQLKDSNQESLEEIRNSLSAEIAATISSVNLTDEIALLKDNLNTGVFAIKEEISKSLNIDSLRISDFMSELSNFKQEIKEDIKSTSLSYDEIKELNSNFEQSIVNTLSSNKTDIENRLEAMSRYNDSVLDKLQKVEQDIELKYSDTYNGKLDALTSAITENDGKLDALTSAITENDGKLESLNVAIEGLNNKFDMSEITSYVDKVNQQLNESLNASLEEINHNLEEKIEALAINEGFSTLKRDILQDMTDSKEQLNGEIFKLKGDINNTFIKFKENLVEEVENALSKITEVPFDDILNRIGKVEENLVSFTDRIESSTTTIDGLGISVDTLLKQAEENASSQGDILSSVIAVSSQLSITDSKLEDVLNSIEKYIENLSENSQDNAKNDREIADELAIKLSEVIKDISQDQEVNKKIANELSALRNVVLTRLTGPDVAYDLSSLYSELQKIRLFIDKKEKGETLYNENFLRLNSDIDALRSELNKVSKISGDAITSSEKLSNKQ